MKTGLLRLSSLAVVSTMFTGCFTAISGPDGGYVAAGVGPRRAGVVVDPPGPGAVAVGAVAPRRRVYVEEPAVIVRPRPAVVVIPRSSPRVVYRGQSAYYWNGNYYRRSRGGYVIIR